MTTTSKTKIIANPIIKFETGDLVTDSLHEDTVIMVNSPQDTHFTGTLLYSKQNKIGIYYGYCEYKHYKLFIGELLIKST